MIKKAVIIVEYTVEPKYMLAYEAWLWSRAEEYCDVRLKACGKRKEILNY